MFEVRVRVRVRVREEKAVFIAVCPGESSLKRAFPMGTNRHTVNW